MAALPCGDWTTGAPLAIPPDWPARILNDPVRHVFTHFSLELTVVALSPPGDPAPVLGAGRWASAADLAALPTVMKKVRRRIEETRR